MSSWDWSRDRNSWGHEWSHHKWQSGELPSPRASRWNRSSWDDGDGWNRQGWQSGQQHEKIIYIRKGKPRAPKHVRDAMKAEAAAAANQSENNTTRIPVQPDHPPPTQSGGEATTGAVGTAGAVEEISSGEIAISEEALERDGIYDQLLNGLEWLKHEKEMIEAGVQDATLQEYSVKALREMTEEWISVRDYR